MSYVTAAELRADAGLDPTAYPDLAIQKAIILATAIFERATRQFFEPRAGTLLLDGDGSNTIHLPIPIVTVGSLFLNGQPTVLDPALYSVYSSANLVDDDRKNPRIALGNSGDVSDIFVSPFTFGPLRFARGRKNQRVTGVFGYVEADGSTPVLVKYAIERLALGKMGILSTGGVGSPTPPPPLPSTLGGVIQETTDGHSIRYDARTARSVGLSGILANDIEVEDIVRMYRAPMAIAVTGSSFISS